MISDFKYTSMYRYGHKVTSTFTHQFNCLKLFRFDLPNNKISFILL